MGSEMCIRDSSPAALSVVIRLFVGDERNRALGIWSALGGGGAAVGVLLGGLITAGPGWPWVFFINIPVGLIVLIGLLRVLPPLPPARTPQSSLDVLGALLVTAATGSAIYSLTVAGETGWTAVKHSRPPGPQWCSTCSSPGDRRPLHRR